MLTGGKTNQIAARNLSNLASVLVLFTKQYRKIRDNMDFLPSKSIIVTSIIFVKVQPAIKEHNLTGFVESSYW